MHSAKITGKLLTSLDPKPTDKVLDVGCGDGKFTANFLPAIESVVGIDSSASMIESANKDYASPKASFRVVDCRYLEKETSIVNGSWDKVYVFDCNTWCTINVTRLLTPRQNLQRSPPLDST